MKLTDQSLMPIGALHRGKKMEDVPADYLLKYWEEWGLWDRAKIYSEEYFAVHDYIVENFSTLETESTDVIITHRPGDKPKPRPEPIKLTVCSCCHQGGQIRSDGVCQGCGWRNV